MSLSAADRQQIQHVLNTYCHAIDYGQPEAMRDIFAEDMTFRAPDFKQSFEGSAAFIEFLHQRLATRDATRHVLGNVVIEERDGVVTSSAYLQVIKVAENPPQLMVVVRYLDEWIATADGWRIKRRRMER